MKQSVAVIIPTLNAGPSWPSFLEALRRQTIEPEQVLIVDSSSTDVTKDLARAAGYDVISITRAEFNHGKTRQLAADMVPEADFIVYLTQDAQLLRSESIKRLLEPFSDPTVGATYGRQLPRPDAGPIEAHARTFSYPAQSSVKSWEDRRTLGIRAAFLSNSFAAYRRSALLEVGGFPDNTIMAEDAIVAGRLLIARWKIAYVAEAEVVHSHPYSILEEFERNFDIGVYHNREHWMLEQFGTASGEGKRFVISELRTLWPRYLYLIPFSLLRILAKYVGYNLGRHEASLNNELRRKLSMHKRFWDQPAAR